MDDPIDRRTAYEHNRALCAAINFELDRLQWSSDTAPAGNTCLDAFPTQDAGVIIVADTQEETPFASEALLRALCWLTPPITYEHLWHAMLPCIIQD
jgi:hypothetical protein